MLVGAAATGEGHERNCRVWSWLVPAMARATATPPPGWSVYEESPGQVIVRALAYTPPGAPSCSDGGLLRQDSSGAVVEITTCYDGSCYQDQYVPAGTYQCGFGEPSAWCGAYVTITIQGADPSCVRTVAAPLPAAGVPWDGTRPCSTSTSSHDGGGGCEATRKASELPSTAVLVFLAALVVRSIRRRWRIGSLG